MNITIDTNELFDIIESHFKSSIDIGLKPALANCKAAIAKISDLSVSIQPQSTPNQLAAITHPNQLAKQDNGFAISEGMKYLFGIDSNQSTQLAVIEDQPIQLSVKPVRNDGNQDYIGQVSTFTNKMGTFNCASCNHPYNHGDIFCKYTGDLPENDVYTHPWCIMPGHHGLHMNNLGLWKKAMDEYHKQSMELAEGEIISIISSLDLEERHFDMLNTLSRKGKPYKSGNYYIITCNNTLGQTLATVIDISSYDKVKDNISVDRNGYFKTGRYLFARTILDIPEGSKRKGKYKYNEEGVKYIRDNRMSNIRST